MGDTKEKILMTALQLFARDGYEAVSVRNIAEELSMTKGALYRHYKNKRDIFDSIVDRMIQIDAERATDNQMPAGSYDTMPESYENTSLEDIQKYTIEQLKFWTEDDFAVKFRRMLTLEQYRSNEMEELYHQCIVEGPVTYMEDLFRELIKKGVLKEENPKQLAVEYYAPLFLLIAISDREAEKASEENTDDEQTTAERMGENKTNEEQTDYVEILRNHTKHFMQCHGVDLKE